MDFSLDTVRSKTAFTLAGLILFTVGMYTILETGGSGVAAWAGLGAAILGSAMVNGLPGDNKLVQTVTNTPRGLLLLGIAFTVMVIARNGVDVLADRFLFAGFSTIMLALIFSGVLRDLVGSSD